MDLEYHNQDLFCQDWSLSNLADEFGTPLYVLSRKAVRRSIKNFLKEFQDQDLPVKIHYSVKTNPVPGFLRILKQEGIRVEVISEHEFKLSRHLGFEEKDIVVNGPSKTPALLDSLRDLPVKMVTIESAGEFSRVKAAAEGFSKPVNIGLRICPGFSFAKIKPTLNSSAKDSPYGFLPDSPEIWEILRDIDRSDKLRFVGFHIHLGSGIKDSRPYRKAFSLLEHLTKKAMRHGWTCRILDIGGGFGMASSPIMSLPQLAKAAICRKQASLQSNNSSPMLKDIAVGLAELLSRLRRSGCDIEEVLIEPGRVISGPSQILILSVLEVIKRSNGHRFLICDGGAMSLTPLLLTEFHRIIPLRCNGKRLVNYTLLGNLPTTLDKLSTSASLPAVQEGDRLALLDAGAYFVPMNNNFAGPRPAIFLVDGKKSGLIRRRETFDDIYHRDII